MGFGEVVVEVCNDEFVFGEIFEDCFYFFLCFVGIGICWIELLEIFEFCESFLCCFLVLVGFFYMFCEG